MWAASLLCGTSSAFSGISGGNISVFPSNTSTFSAKTKQNVRFRVKYVPSMYQVCSKYVPIKLGMYLVCTIIPMKSIKVSCPALSIVLTTEAYPTFNLSLVSHTHGDVPCLVRVERSGLEEKHKTGECQLEDDR